MSEPFDERFAAVIRAGLDEGIAKSVPSMVETVMKSLFGHRAYRVIVGGQLRLMETGMDPMEAWTMSRNCLVEFLKSEKVEVGDPAYDWSTDAGRVIVEEMEIDHWESKP